MALLHRDRSIDTGLDETFFPFFLIFITIFLNEMKVVEGSLMNQTAGTVWEKGRIEIN